LPVSNNLARSTFVTLSAAALAELSLLGTARDPKTMRVRIGADISNLDPLRIFQIENQTVAGNIYNGLVKFDEKTNKIVPDLARNWTVTSDGKSYTFHLRPNVKWHKNYGTLTSDDVKFSIERIIDPAQKSSYAAQFADVEKVEAVDPLTVRVLLKRPSGGFADKVAAFNQGWIVNRKAVTELGDKYQLNPIGTGPFVFERWSTGSEVALKANSEYFEGKPAFDNLVFALIKEETAAAIALDNGEIDVFFNLQSPEIIQKLRSTKGITVASREADHTINLVLNTQIKPLDDRRVRQAIAYGLNRKALIADFFKGTKGEAYSVLTASFPEYTSDVPKYPYDPAKAKALLADAKASGFTLELVSVANHPYDQIVVPMAADLTQIGIQTKITILERGAYLQARNKGDIPTAITGVTGAPDPDSPLATLYATKSFPPGLNTAHYSGVDDLLEKASTELEDKKRIAIYREVLKKTMTDVPVIPLYADRLFLGYRSAIRGITQNSLFTFNAYGAKMA
jgi:ABC-type transport system substrate-binding protein